MYCKHCGKKIPESSKFCRYCGSRLVGSREVVSAGDEITKSAINLDYAGFWIRFGAYIIDILGMLGGAIAIGAILGYLFGDSVDELPDIFWNYFSYVIYNTFALTIWSTTLGKYLFGLKVVTEKNEDLNFGLALKRSLLQPLSTFFFGVGYWNMNKNDRKQAWHDTKTGIIVTREKKNLALAYIVMVIAIIVWAYFYSLGMEQ